MSILGGKRRDTVLTGPLDQTVTALIKRVCVGGGYVRKRERERECVCGSVCL